MTTRLPSSGVSCFLFRISVSDSGVPMALSLMEKKKKEKKFFSPSVTRKCQVLPMTGILKQNYL